MTRVCYSSCSASSGSGRSMTGSHLRTVISFGSGKRIGGLPRDGGRRGGGHDLRHCLLPIRIPVPSDIGQGDTKGGSALTNQECEAEAGKVQEVPKRPSEGYRRDAGGRTQGD